MSREKSESRFLTPSASTVHTHTRVVYHTSQLKHSLNSNKNLSKLCLLMVCSHRRHDDETVLSVSPIVFKPLTRQFCLVSTQFRWVLVRIGGVNATADKTKLSRLVSSCVHTANSTRQDSFVSSASAVWTSHHSNSRLGRNDSDSVTV